MAQERDEFEIFLSDGPDIDEIMEWYDRLTARIKQLENDLYHQAHNASESAARSIAIDAKLGRAETLNTQLLDALKKIDGWFEGVIEDSPKNWLELGSIAKAAIHAAEEYKR